MIQKHMHLGTITLMSSFLFPFYQMHSQRWDYTARKSLVCSQGRMRKDPMALREKKRDLSLQSNTF